MKNKDTILKYLSDLMSPDEKSNFEKLLESDSDLKSEFERISNSIGEFSNSTKSESESAYFTNLVPRIHERMAAEKNRGIIRFAPGFSFGIVAILLLLLQIPQRDDNSIFEFNNTYDELTNIFSENDDTLFSDYFELGLVDDYSYYSYESDDTFPDIYIDQSILSEIGYDSESEFYDYSFSSSIDEYSSEEANIIYSELINKKIL